jgi:hypothetical protein
VLEEPAMDPKEEYWQQVYDARSAYFESTVGPLPGDILKMLNMTGIWPGGGLFVIPAERIGPGIWVYTTFGFTNVDMPTSVTSSDSRFETDAQGRRQMVATLQSRVPAPSVPGRAGYGYEILVLTEGRADWPLSFLQWAVNAEMMHDVGLLDRVEKHEGLTVEDIAIGADGAIDVLIAKSHPPLPGPIQLPNGAMQLLVATTITADEMTWSFDHGRPALLERLARAGMGQISVRGRDSAPL